MVISAIQDSYVCVCVSTYVCVYTYMCVYIYVDIAIYSIWLTILLSSWFSRILLEEVGNEHVICKRWSFSCFLSGVSTTGIPFLTSFVLKKMVILKTRYVTYSFPTTGVFPRCVFSVRANHLAFCLSKLAALFACLIPPLFINRHAPPESPQLNRVSLYSMV